VTDRELLELAAKAAGIKIEWAPTFQGNGAYYLPDSGKWPTLSIWNPLTDDGDALRLAVGLGLVVDCSRPSAGEPFKLSHSAQEDFQDRNAATRRAIVRAAAEIGKGMK
jgi:hypothetical protein